jgi:hypothetical protein
MVETRKENVMFRVWLVLVITAFVLSAAAIDQPVRPTPVVKVLAPSPAKAGDELIATGQHLGKDFVSAVYLTKGEDIVPLEVKSQAENSIRVKLPDTLKPGRFGFMVLTSGDVPRYIDEPVFLNIE